MNILILLLLLYCIPVAFCKWHLRYNNVVDKSLCYNPKKWASFITGFLLSKLIKPHILEQLILRVYNDDECNKCYINDKCSHCGCNRSKFLVPWESCDKVDEIDAPTGWGEMILNEDEYKTLRKQHPVEIKVSITYK